ncbi:hypothetical protein CEXT_268401 [Caerostris extrusa]|uniref:Uncharacterized protein n=1 Tax=Caerostris extrusa TaxID=172846 RepID=A0AAV4T0K2_CAEEX|nr:hypothetical protein CEXT_268401 [Caerostris extrusa]
MSHCYGNSGNNSGQLRRCLRFLRAGSRRNWKSNPVWVSAVGAYFNYLSSGAILRSSTSLPSFRVRARFLGDLKLLIFIAVQSARFTIGSLQHGMNCVRRCNGDLCRSWMVLDCSARPQIIISCRVNGSGMAGVSQNNREPSRTRRHKSPLQRRTQFIPYCKDFVNRAIGTRTQMVSSHPSEFPNTETRQDVNSFLI